jgi:hypothetical protein
VVLLGLVLLHLASVSGNLRRYRRQAEILQEFLVLRGPARDQTRDVIHANYLLGVAFFHLRQETDSTQYLKLALKSAGCNGQEELADQCRHMLRANALRASDHVQFQTWLSASAVYVHTTPEDVEARFHYWFDWALLLFQQGKPMQALPMALNALNVTVGETEFEYQCLWFMHRCALANEDRFEALQFAFDARICAMEGQRPDLGAETTAAIAELIKPGGAPVLAQLQRHYDARGIDVFRYIPEQLHVNDGRAIRVVSTAFGAPA